LRQLLRAMNSYYSNKIEGQHTLPLEIEQALLNDYAAQPDKARRQRLAIAHMQTEAQLERLWPGWSRAQVWLGQTLQDMKDRMAACLHYEQQVVQQGVRVESLRVLHYLFAAQTELDRSDFKAMLGLGDRLATAQVSALLKRGLVETGSPYGKLRLGVPQHALGFYFPKLWPEAEGA
jgi:Fic family protein